MLIDSQYLRNSKKLVLSYIDKSGKTKLKYYDWANPEKYQTWDSTKDDESAKHDLYKSWDGNPVKKISGGYPDRYSTYEFLDALPQAEKDEIFEYNEPEIYFIDIETEILDGFPDAETAPTRVLAISIVYGEKIILMGVKEMPEDMQKRIIDNTNLYFKKFDSHYQFKYIKYADEFDMLKAFFEEMTPKMTCLTGWNFINYDWMYLLNRARKLSKDVNGATLSIDVLASSPTKLMKNVWMSTYELPVHKLIFDYMQLYEAFDTSIKVKESSSLDYVANKLVGVEKIKYTGSLQKLYEEDFETYMYYNAVDSVLVQKIHESKNYISIIYAVSALAKIKTSDVISPIKSALASLAITEGV
jgi:DNA polymerase elongation subunit (family B)